MNPTTAADLGVWNVVINLVDSASHTATFSFNVNVLNEPPTYVDPTVSYQPFSIALNSIYHLPIFRNYDPEGSPVIVVITDAAATAVNYVIAGDNS